MVRLDKVRAVTIMLMVINMMESLLIIKSMALGN